MAAAPGAAQGPPLRAVEVVREDVFDAAESRAWPFRVATWLHVTTRERVVRREVLLVPGAPWDSARAAETERNLRALGIFRRVRLDTLTTDSGLVARVTTRDGWTTRPVFSLSTSGGQAAVAAGVREDNLLGLGARFSAEYRTNPDREQVILAFRQPRAIGSRVLVSARADFRSDGRDYRAGAGLPYLSLSSRASALASGLTFDGDVLRFRDGDPRPAEVLRRRYALLRADGGWAPVASPRGFVRVAALAQLRRDDFVDTALVGAAPFPSTVTGAVGIGLAARRADFAIVRNVRSFLREEDVDLSRAAALTLLAAPAAWGYPRDGIGVALGLQAGFRIPAGFVQLGASANGLWTGAGLDSGTVVARATVVVQPHPMHVVTVGGTAGWQEDQVPGEEFDLGLTSGPRAFPLHAFTGDRSYFVTAEYRWTAWEDLYGLAGIGAAAFVDHGGAWYAGSTRRTGTNLGAGLRFGSSRTSQGSAGRLDLAWRVANDREPAGWVISVGQAVRF